MKLVCQDTQWLKDTLSQLSDNEALCAASDLLVVGCYKHSRVGKAARSPQDLFARAARSHPRRGSKPEGATAVEGSIAHETDRYSSKQQTELVKR